MSTVMPYKTCKPKGALTFLSYLVFLAMRRIRSARTKPERESIIPASAACQRALHRDSAQTPIFDQFSSSCSKILSAS